MWPHICSDEARGIAFGFSPPDDRYFVVREELAAAPGSSGVSSRDGLASLHPGELLHVGDYGTERVPIEGIAMQGLGMEHELASLRRRRKREAEAAQAL
ncbi:hypothetical protein ABIA85_009945 [Bradyrhizobium sp. LA6.10]|uniref:hypothetical protein n=1 Tax=unclassified Bradyrhizobium TaxID=2631580 RepID=UPI00339A3D66